MRLTFELQELRDADQRRHFTRILLRIADGWHFWAGPDPDVDPYRGFFETHGTLYRELAEKSYSEFAKYAPSQPMRELLVTQDRRVGEVGGVSALGLAAAGSTLNEPLILMVENEVNDGAFYRMCFEAVAPELAERFGGEAPAVRFHNGGGGTTGSVFEAHAARAASEGLLLRMVVLVDSDAKFPGHESATATRLRELVEEHQVAFVALRKRAIENYIPDDVVRAVAATDPSRRPAANFILGLPREARDHYPIKKGLKLEGGLPPFKDGPEQQLYAPVKLSESAHRLPDLVSFLLSGASPELTSASLQERNALEEIHEICTTISREL